MEIDLHKKYFVSTIMDKEGKVFKRSRVSTDRESIKHYFSHEISPFVNEAILAHPLKTRAIAEARIKTDY